jgi:hypothetical protein
MHDDNHEAPAQAYHRTLWFSKKFGKKSWA